MLKKIKIKLLMKNMQKILRHQKYEFQLTKKNLIDESAEFVDLFKFTAEANTTYLKKGIECIVQWSKMGTKRKLVCSFLGFFL